jgi:hypothetical protein
MVQFRAMDDRGQDQGFWSLQVNSEDGKYAVVWIK